MSGDLTFRLILFSTLASVTKSLFHRSCENCESYSNGVQKKLFVICGEFSQHILYFCVKQLVPLKSQRWDNEASKRKRLLYSRTRKSQIIPRDMWYWVLRFLLVKTLQCHSKSHMHMTWQGLIRHFRVTLLCLCFKTSLLSKPLIWKWIWFAWKWTCRRNTVSYEWSHAKTRFDTEAKGNSGMAYCDLRPTVNADVQTSFYCTHKAVDAAFFCLGYSRI